MFHNDSNINIVLSLQTVATQQSANVVASLSSADKINYQPETNLLVSRVYYSVGLPLRCVDIVTQYIDVARIYVWWSWFLHQGRILLVGIDPGPTLRMDHH